MMRWQQTGLILIMSFTGWLNAFAQGASNACANYPPRTQCDTFCDGYCRTTSCSARTVLPAQVTNTPWWINDRPLLPVKFLIPSNSCYRPNQNTEDINSLPVQYQRNGITITSSSIPHSFFLMTYPACAQQPPVPNGIACPTTPTTPTGCPPGYQTIPNGTYAGKCGKCPTSGGGAMTVVETNGTPIGSIPGECGSCTSTCANFVECYYRSCATGVVTRQACGIAGGGTLPCGMPVSFASCPTVANTTDCTFVSADDPSPQSTAETILNDTARVAGFCAGSPSPTVPTSSTSPPACNSGNATCDANCSSLTVTMFGGQFFTLAQVAGMDNSWYCYGPVSATGQYAGAGCTTGGSCTTSCRQCSQTNPNPTMTTTTGGGPGPGSGCFLAGTNILMADGSLKAIETIEVGELIQIFDESLQQRVISPVTETLHHEAMPQRLFRMSFSNGKSFVVNDVHPLYVFNSERYSSSANVFSQWISGLNPTLQDQEGNPISIVDIETWEAMEPTYNLHVEGISSDKAIYGIRGRGHNYFAEGILVHNVKDAEGSL